MQQEPMLAGEVSNEAKRLLDVTKKAFFEGIKFAKPRI